MTLDSALSLAGITLETAVVALLLYRRAWRTWPIFFVYSVWTPLSGVAEQLVFSRFAAQYFQTFIVVTGVDSLLQFCVLVELAWSVFRPFRASLPRNTIWFLGGLVALTGAIIWPFAQNPAFAHFPAQWQLLGRFLQTDSILRVLVFLILAGCSQLLSIGWRDRELQVATGLGFYSLIALAVTALQAHMGANQHFRNLEQLLAASYVASLGYWVLSFAQKEAERREFSPQMQGLLLAVAGAARSSRISLTGASSGKSRTGRDL